VSPAGVVEPRQLSDGLVVIIVEDEINQALAGRSSCHYESPPQSREQALTLVRVLLGSTTDELDGAERWTCPIAGGRRTVTVKHLAIS
jgi:hypothetical protein